MEKFRLSRFLLPSIYIDIPVYSYVTNYGFSCLFLNFPSANPFLALRLWAHTFAVHRIMMTMMIINTQGELDGYILLGKADA